MVVQSTIPHPPREASMSQPNSSDPRPIPTAILVPPEKAEKRPRRRKVLPGPNIPWIKIAIGGSAAWMAIVVVVALYYRAQGETLPIDDGDLPRGPVVKLVDREPVIQKPIVAPIVQEPLAEVPVLPLNKEAFVNCDQIGVNVLFMKDPTEAFKRARSEKKMVFMIHLSGNLEDKDFT
jgi:hypothetical protein